MRATSSVHKVNARSRYAARWMRDAPRRDRFPIKLPRPAVGKNVISMHYSLDCIPAISGERTRRNTGSRLSEKRRAKLINAEANANIVLAIVRRTRTAVHTPHNDNRCRNGGQSVMGAGAGAGAEGGGHAMCIRF